MFAAVVSQACAQFLAKTILDPVQRAGQPIGDVVGQVFACENETPGADRGDRRRLVRIAVGGHRQRLEKCVPGADARDLVGVRRDESRAAGAFRHRGESGPADAGAPQRGGAAVQHHRRPVAGAFEIDRLEILVLLQPEAIEHVARQDRQARAPGAERDRLAHEIANGLVGAIGPHHEHAGARIHRGQYLEPGCGAPDAHEGLVGRLARHRRDIELARFQQRNVLVGAPGVARLDRQRRIGGIDGFGECVAIEREAASGRRGPQADRGLWNGLASLLRRGAAQSAAKPRRKP